MKDNVKRPRFYAPNLSAGALALSAEESHHARSVLRLKTGQAVELFDGLGRVAAGEIVSLERNETTVRVGEVAAGQAPSHSVHLAFVVPKGKRLDWLLEKATELGVASFWPVVCERSVAAGGRIERWTGHCISAAKQCGLNWLPAVHELTPLADFLAGVSAGQLGLGDATLILGDMSSQARSLAEVLQSAGKSDNVVLLIGPEGGFTDEEIDAIIACGFDRARLGETTLRIETAAIALLAGVRCQYSGDRSQESGVRRVGSSDS